MLFQKFLYFLLLLVVILGMDKKSKEPQKYFAAALSHLAQQKWGLQTELAKKIGVSQQTISKLASGKMEGKEADRRHIAAILEYEYEDFLQFGYNLIHGTVPNTISDNETIAFKRQLDFLLNEASAEEQNFLKLTVDNLYRIVKSRNPKNKAK